MDVLNALGDPTWFADDWPATPYHRVGTAAELRATLTWSALDTILKDQGLQAPAFRMARDHQLVPMEKLTRPERHTSQAIQGLADPVRIGAELTDGATLVLQGLQRFWPPLADTCRRLAAEIGHPVFVNAYLTPRTERGFGAHHDPYHAWLTQVAGSKSWQLWAPQRDPATDPADLEITLAEGDVLWIPRGWWHTGSSGAKPSLHLTFTVWATKLDAVLRVLLTEVLREPGLARELPPGAFRDGARTEATIAMAMVEIADMIAKLDPATVATRVVDARLEQFDPLPAQSVWSVIGGDRAARFHAHPEGVLHVDGVRLRTADRLLALEPGQEDRCRTVLGRTGSFTLTELDADQELLDLLIDARLVCAAPCPGC
ncbi:lysine-specific demethylase/histidyl-hydroxylase NO66 [Streptomyces sp. LBL]|uniref:JmjC domain-containing protein n=1 Tax=Streptomyces sp. LBL TaxID=2940562 RepID=UPI0024772C99|nr:cupin domain-containing protein [Streptomyces sp. LBL]MDH6622928.1 lysine-specific demethylase/histidyl-hydroxylase NO66 [Streptomyces sp. LBL]